MIRQNALRPESGYELPAGSTREESMPVPGSAVFELSDRFTEEYAKACPVLATMAGIPRPISAWDDYSPEGARDVEALCRRTRDELSKISLDGLAPRERDREGLARDVLRDFLDERVEFFETKDNLLDLNSIDSPAQHLRTVFDLMGTKTADEWSAIATRLATIGSAFGGYRRALEDGSNGKVSSRQVTAVIQQMDAHAADTSSYRELLTTFDESPLAGDASLRADLERGITNARAASADFGGFLRGYAEGAPSKDAVGEERYVRAVRRFLGTKLDLRETYAWGFDEIRRIERDMAECAKKVRIDAPNSDVRSVIAALQADPARQIFDRDAFLAFVRERQLRALADLGGTHFDIPEPIRHVDVRLGPKGGPLGAYYVPPNEDFSRPGSIFYSPAEGAPYLVFSELTTAYHEGFPGHHLQCGLQVYFSESLSRFHRLFVVCSGYAEGWALYAENLMAELGYFEEPEYLLGMYMAKLFRACRVVADIGTHLEYTIPTDFDFHPGETWNWALCAEILATRGMMPLANAESEATRYTGWPAQAISYKVGERVITDLRKDCVRGDFTLRNFHDAVLGTGSVGLDILKERVRARTTLS